MPVLAEALAEIENDAHEDEHPECSSTCSMCNPGVDPADVPTWLTVDAVR